MLEHIQVPRHHNPSRCVFPSKFDQLTRVAVEGCFCVRFMSFNPFGGNEAEVPEPVVLDWGAPLRPRHFDFSEASAVKLAVPGAARQVYTALSVPGSGRFQESDDSTPVEFYDGAIIVKAGDRYKLFTLEDFSERFVLMSGQRVESIYQIDYQTPKK